MNPASATIDDVARRCAAAFRPSPHRRIGAEVEWLVFDRDDPERHVDAATTARVAAGALPAAGRLSVEPGGQLELSTQPFPGPGELLDAVDADTRVLVERFDRDGLDLVPLGLDPIRPPRRSLDVARYAAMEQYFATRWPAGVDMMTRTASLQLNVDVGPDPGATWGRAHRLAPFLAAMFANSPTTDGVEHAPVSHRQRTWAATDPSRTDPVGPEPSDWLRYVMHSFVMLRFDGGADVSPLFDQRTLAEVLAGDSPLSVAELDLHLTTLFPPVRPRGHLELRMIDAVPAVGRAAAIATAWILLTDPGVETEIAEVCQSVCDPWDVALDRGLADDRLRQAVADLLGLAASRLGAGSGELADACEGWRNRRVGRAGPPTFLEMPVPEPW